MRAVALLVIALGAGCATTHVSPARFVSRSPTGGVVATPRAEVGMDDANEMIAAHCGAGGYAVTREGEALVGSTVVTEGASSLDAQTTDGSGQMQGHDSQKTVYATGSNWQINYSCNDPRTVNMALITRTRTTPSRVAWGVDAGTGVMFLTGKTFEQYDVQVPREGRASTIGANAWLGYMLSDKFALGGGLGTTQVLAMPQWNYYNDDQSMPGVERDARSLEFFATANYALSTKADVRVRAGLSDWDGVRLDGGAPFAAAQLNYRVIDVGPSNGVYVGGAVSSYFSSDMTSNFSPSLLVGFH